MGRLESSRNQEIIAALMAEDYSEIGSLASGGNSGSGPDSLPQSGSITNVVDGRSHRSIPQVRECQASSCNNNTEGRYCCLTAIKINKVGGCADYEAAAEDEDQESIVDQETIEGISNMMPNDDLPTSISGQYDPSQNL